MRVAFPFVGSHVGGASVSTVEMVRRLLEDGRVEPIVVVPRDGPSVPLFRAAGLEPTLHDPDVVHATTLRASTSSWGGKLRAVPTYLAIRGFAERFMRRRQIDVVHLNEDRLVVPWGLAARGLGVQVVWHVRQERPNPLLDGLRLRLSDAVIFVADANRMRFRRLPPSLPTATIHNVVDPCRFHPGGDARAARVAAGLDPDRLTVTFVGNLFARKRPHWLLRATAELQRRHHLQVLIVGAPLGPASYHRHLRSAAAAVPEPRHVHFLGLRDDVADLLRASDVVTLPSVVQGEAFPRAIIEAMACGVPVVATDVAGVREAVDDGETGLVVHPERFEEYVAALDRVLDSEQLRRNLGHQAHAVVRIRFLGATMAADLQAVYGAVLGAKRA
jgi:D-inositol-3-phosphate glycosyltransferase